MTEEFLTYYERELQVLRQLGADFAEKYPKIAARLVLEADKCEDPHVERLLEGFAFLAARIHQKLDDDFPEITQGLLNIVYPHYLAPMPSASIAQFRLDRTQSQLTNGYAIPAGTTLRSRASGGMMCRFRTCSPTTLWPLDVTEAQWVTPDRISPPLRAPGALAAIRLKLQCVGDASLDKLDLDELRFYLDGPADLTHSLYEVLFNNCQAVYVRNPERPRDAATQLLPGSLSPGGFDESDALLPYPKRSFPGYRLLHEYFLYPEKFLFARISGLRSILAQSYGKSAELIFFVSTFEREDRWQMLELGVRPETFRLSCTPIVNLFEQTSEPIWLDQTQYEYPIIADARRHGSMDVFSVNRVVSQRAGSPDLTEYEPFYSLRHSDTLQSRKTFWYARRRANPARNDQTDVMLALVDLTGRARVPTADAVTVRLTCTNRDLPSRLPFGNPAGDFELEDGGPVMQIVAIEKPTTSGPAFSARDSLWRLVSHLSLNHLSLVSDPDRGEDGSGAEALREILRLYNVTNSISTERKIQGVLSVRSQPHFARVLSQAGMSFARGQLVQLELDEEQFVGSGAYLFSEVLDRFFGMYVSLNSFTQLEVSTNLRREVMKRWAPRAGRKILA